MELPDATYAVEPRFKRILSPAILRGDVLYQNGPWDAALAGIDGLCQHFAVSTIGSDLSASVADECRLQPDRYPLLSGDHHQRIEEAK